MARLNRAWLPHVLLGLLTLALTLWLWRWAVLNRSWGNDEELYRHFAQGVANNFSLLWHMDPSYGRGIQRLHLLLLGVPMAIWDNPTAFVVAHLLFVAVYASAAIPAWLIARGCGLNPYAALLPAALVVLTPWSVIATSFLAEPVGYGVFAWAVWAIWRAATRPSIAADVLAVLLVGLALLSRTGFLLLLPVLPVVAVLQAWRYGTGQGPIANRLRRLPLSALRRQPLSVSLGVLGVLIVLAAWTRILPGGPERFTGTYSTHLPPLWLMAGKWRSFLSRIDAGTGFVLFAAAIPWLLARVVKPRDAATHAFAWTGLLAGASVLVSLVGGPADERYVMFVAFPVVLGACIGLLRRELGPVLLLLGSAAALVLFFTPGWKLNDVSDFGYFSFPVDTFMWRVVLTKLGNAVSSVDAKTTGGVLLGLALLAVVAIAWRPAWRRWLPLVVVPAALFQLAVSGYSIRKHVNTVGNHYGPDLKARAWVDEHVPRDSNVGTFAVSQGRTADYNSVFREIEYWNTSMESVVSIASPITTFPSADIPYEFGSKAVTGRLDLTNGRIQNSGPSPFPQFLVTPQPPLSVVMNWRDVVQATYIPAKLVQVRRPLEARGTLAGVTPTGFVDPGATPEIRLYRAPQPPTQCLIVDLRGPPDAPKPDESLPFRIWNSASGNLAKGRAVTGKVQRAYVPVRFTGDDVGFDIITKGTLHTANGDLPLQVANWEPTGQPCPK